MSTFVGAQFTYPHLGSANKNRSMHKKTEKPVVRISICSTDFSVL